jgi:hypothetical protein
MHPFTDLIDRNTVVALQSLDAIHEVTHTSVCSLCREVGSKNIA